MKPLTGTIIKSLVFIVVTALATTVLAATIRNSGTGNGAQYSAIFADATSLNLGDDIRMAGVKVGSVGKIEVTGHNLAKVTFDIASGIRINSGAKAALHFRNLVGQRYIAVQQGNAAGAPLPSGHVFGTDETQPALDLTMLFNGFQPLFRLLSPKDVNNLSEQIISVFQGEGGTMEGLLSSTASLTSTLAAKDKVIGELIDNLNVVLKTVNGRSDQLTATIDTMQKLVSGLADDRKTIGSTFEGVGALTTQVASLLEEGRAPLKRSIRSLDALSGNLADSEPVITNFLQTLPTKLDQIGRIASYGSWFNFYECSISGDIPMPEGYMGDLGAKPVAERCAS